MEERNAQQEYNLYLIVSLRLQLPRLGFMGTLVWFPKWCDCIINVSLSGNVVVLHGTMSTFFHSSHVRSRSCPAEFLWISVEWLTKRFGLNYLSFNSVLRISKEPWTKHFGGGKKKCAETLSSRWNSVERCSVGHFAGLPPKDGDQGPVFTRLEIGGNWIARDIMPDAGGL